MSTCDPEARRRILNRLKRARGQLEAVITAVEEDRPCRDVVTQLSAVSSALDRAGFAIIASAMKECLAAEDAGEDRDPDAVTPEQLEKLFLSLA